jgi:hypothetical protein
LLNKSKSGDTISGSLDQSTLACGNGRTAILVRCELFKIEQIRSAAKRRNMSLNGFVLYTLRHAWSEQYHASVAIGSPSNAFHPNSTS